MDDKISQGLIAELHCDGLAFLDLDGLGRIVQQIARLGSGFLDDQRGPRFYPFHQESAGAVCHELAVGVAHHRAVRFCHQELHIGERRVICRRYLLDQNSSLGGVGEVEGHDVLILAGNIEGLGRGVDHMAAVALQLLADIIALL